MKLDILAFGAHPDDVELSAAGTLLVHLAQGHKCGVVDLTKGELGTRGNAETRAAEAVRATTILGLHARENLSMSDGFFEINRENLLSVARAIRRYRPEIILCNAVADRHPDHGRAGKLVSDAVFLAGLKKVETKDGETLQEHWKTKAVYHYIQDRYIRPDLVVDITPVWEKKMESVMAFSSQFYNPSSDEPETAISGKDFFQFLESRATDTGRPAGFLYAEGFTAERHIGVRNLFSLI